MDVGRVHLCIPHLNCALSQVYISTSPLIEDEQSVWLQCRTCEELLTKVRVTIKGTKEPLLPIIQNQLDIPLISSVEATTGSVVAVIEGGGGICFSKVLQSAKRWGPSHPCNLVLVLQALEADNLLSENLLSHVKNCILSTCDNKRSRWYNILKLFVDDRQRRASMDTETGLRQWGPSFALVATCCLEAYRYTREKEIGMWPRVKAFVNPHDCADVKGNGEDESDASVASNVARECHPETYAKSEPKCHSTSRGCNRKKYVSPAVIEEAVLAVFAEDDHLLEYFGNVGRLAAR